jgi:hypothetical protein
MTNWGALDRFEMEARWTKAALQNVLAKLDQAHLDRSEWDEIFNPADPLETMNSLGFDIVQSRRLQRRNRGISAQRGGPEIAELAIDDVTYRFASGEILHSEVEIEAKIVESSGVIKKVAEALLDRYGTALRIWPYSKFATGQAIEQLLLACKLNDSVYGKRPKPEAYTIIAELLDSKITEP